MIKSEIKSFEITSKTHMFISVRIYPSDFILKKYHNGDTKAHKLLIETYDKYYEFYKKFVEVATGNTYGYYQKEYFLGTKDATKEELHELTGILIATSGDNEVYCIPRNEKNKILFDYIVENVPGKFKILKKTRGTYWDHGPTTWRRDSCKTPENLKNKIY